MSPHKPRVIRPKRSATVALTVRFPRLMYRALLNVSDREGQSRASYIKAKIAPDLREEMRRIERDGENVTA